MARGHDYRNGTRGRSLTTNRRGFVAHITCGKCPTKGDLQMRVIMPPDQIDQKFARLGWAIPPRLCPTCATKPKEKPMASLPTPAAMKAQATMFQLLSQHFDTVDGRYVAEWSDAKIAKETGLAEATVSAFRVAGFGEIREPTEIFLIRQDIGALEKLQQESHAAFGEEIAKLRGRLGDICKSMGLRA